MQATESAGLCRRVFEFLESSIGKKIMVALAGLLLCGFLIMHLLGNLLLFVGPAAFNKYAQTLERNPLLPVAELGLVVLFLIHIALAIRARIANMRARPIGYQVSANKGARTPGSRTMALTGLLVLAFLIVHLKSFRFAEREIRETDMYALVTSAFSIHLYAGFYILAMAGVGLHLSHGFQSGFQTLGLNHPRYTPTVRRVGLAFAVLVALGFASLPLYFGFLQHGGR